MALTSLTSLNSLTSPFAKVEILILLCAKLHNNSVISNAGIQKSLFLGIALHILHRQSLVSDSEFLSLPFCPTRKLSPFRAVCILYFIFNFIFPLYFFFSLCFAAELTITLYNLRYECRKKEGVESLKCEI